MTIDLATATRPRITGVGGAGGNAIDTMVAAGTEGVELVACNTDAQALAHCRAGRRVRLVATVTRGLGAAAGIAAGRRRFVGCFVPPASYATPAAASVGRDYPGRALSGRRRRRIPLAGVGLGAAEVGTRQVREKHE